MPPRHALRNRRGLPPQPSRRWIRSVKPDWRWSGLLTRAQVVRTHPDPPIMDQCPQRPRERILNPSTQVTVGSSPTWSSNSNVFLRKGRNFERQLRGRGGTRVARRDRVVGQAGTTLGAPSSWFVSCRHRAVREKSFAPWPTPSLCARPPWRLGPTKDRGAATVRADAA